MIKDAIRIFKPACLLAVVTMVLTAGPAIVQGQEAELEAARKKIEDLLQKAEQQRKQGAVDKAEQLVEQAQDLKARLAKAVGKRPRKESRGRLEEILEGLKAGAKSLRALGRIEEARRMERLAKEIRAKTAAAAKGRGAEREREAALKQLKIMQMARKGLLEADREDSAELMERAIRALEVALEGRRDEQAQKIRERAPSLGQRVELLMFAARKLREAGKKEQAGAVANLGEMMMKRFRAPQKGQREGGKREPGGKEREVAGQQIEVMNTALKALLEGERKDSAEVLKRAIQARLVRLKRLKGEEAEIVLKREPKLGQTVEALRLASKLWAEFGDEKKAAAVAEFAEKLSVRREGAK